MLVHDLLLNVSVNVPQLELPEGALGNNPLKLWILLDETVVDSVVVLQLERSCMGLFRRNVWKQKRHSSRSVPKRL